MNRSLNTTYKYSSASAWLAQIFFFKHTRPEHLSTQPLTPPATPSPPPLQFRSAKKRCSRSSRSRKGKKHQAQPVSHQPVWIPVLTPIFTKIFNRSLEVPSCKVPSCFKLTTIIPIPKKPKITGLNDYRSVALTSVVMKSFEKLVLAHLKGITGPSLDPLPFAYRANGSVDDEVNMGLHYVLQHLLDQGSPTLLLESYRPEDFSSNPNQTHLNQLIKVFKAAC